jgi:NTE family protein
MLGADVTASTGNVTRSTFDSRVIVPNLGGYGSELRADLRAGYLTHLTAEYYRPLPLARLFVQPHLGLLRQPVYLWADGRRISERFQQQLSGGLDLGKTFSSRTQLTAEWRMQKQTWRLVSGVDGDPNIAGTAQTGLLHFTYDRATAGVVAPHSLRIDTTAGTLFHAPGSELSPVFEVRTSQSYTIHEKNVFAFGTEAHTYFGHTVADPFRFTLGGPLRLSAFNIDEFRGTDEFIVRTAYFRKLASLPTGLGQGVYAVAAYEAGKSWAPERSPILHQDGILGLSAATPLGVFTLGFSAGDSRRHAVFLTIGKLF